MQRRVNTQDSDDVTERKEQQIHSNSAVMDNFSFLILFFLLSEAASDPEPIQRSPGQNVTLKCQTDASISAVEWTRPDLEPKYVLLNVDGHPETKEQHPSFKNRVELVNRELRGGDVSLTLTNLTNKDTGTYECRVAAGSRRTKRSNIYTEPIRIIHLEVTDSGPRVRVGLAAASGLVLVCAAAIVVWGYKRFTDKKSEPADDEASEKTLV